MPELPEVETVRRGLAPSLKGRRITEVLARRPDLRVPLPARFAERLTGRRVRALRRRAKYILADLDSGETLIVHLGMSGRLTVHKGKSEPPPLGLHDHVVIETDAPARIVFTDHRRFGLMTIADTATLDRHELFRALGPEPLSSGFDAAFLNEALAGKRTPIKAALLDQHVVAGLGNIYVCEALFRAGISPKRVAASIPGARAMCLVRAIKDVLTDAIAAGGSSLRDYAQADGELGLFQHRFSAYDREGEPCKKRGCRGTIKRIAQSGRSTFYCPSCQR